MHLLYNAGIYILMLAIRIAAPFNPKARAWITGRKHWRKRYAADFQKKGKLLWVHVASLGEFEQGRPLIEAFRRDHPGWQIVLSFFSPSGYAIRKNYPHADYVCYLPADTPLNARDFLDLFQPDAAVFVKYEFWANYLFELKQRETPTLLISALFRPGQPFFQWYGAFWRRILGCFGHIFLQNESSVKLLWQINYENYTVAGDTRVDRVLELATQVERNVAVASFLVTPSPVTGLIAGSTWPEDEAILLPLIEHPDFSDLRWIIAPHEPSEKHIKHLCSQLKRPFLRYSEFVQGKDCAAQVLLIDNVGLLNSLYQYGRVAYIGGGFGKGIHNTLEPAAFGLPIIFGPRYEKFEEARQFVARGGAFPVRNTEELAATLIKLRDPDFYEQASNAVRAYLQASRGATQSVLQLFDAMSS